MNWSTYPDFFFVLFCFFFLVYFIKLFTFFRQESLLSSISEKDNQIAQMELQSSKTKKQDIKQLKLEKEKFVGQLKAQV